jgi:hypothetical protein
MDDDQIRGRLEDLVSESTHSGSARLPTSQPTLTGKRLDSLKVTLDQCWDRLRQRRSLREAGLDPEAVRVRDTDVVEHYQQ